MPKRDAKARLLHTVYDRLFALYGVCECPLLHRNSYELLVAVVLSAQCKDERVNLSTPALFERYPTPHDLAHAELADVEKLIHSVGLYRAKAANLVKAMQQIIRDHHGEVPADMDQLTSLPGVGRKTANVMLSNAFSLPGFPVDTHVKRLLNRLGVVHCDDPEKIEQEVNVRMEPPLWGNFSHLLIWHGRRICDARKPDCAGCVLLDLCKEGKKRTS